MRCLAGPCSSGFPSPGTWVFRRIRHRDRPYMAGPSRSHPSEGLQSGSLRSGFDRTHVLRSTASSSRGCARRHRSPRRNAFNPRRSEAVSTVITSAFCASAHGELHTLAHAPASGPRTYSMAHAFIRSWTGQLLLFGGTFSFFYTFAGASDIWPGRHGVPRRARTCRDGNAGDDQECMFPVMIRLPNSREA